MHYQSKLIFFFCTILILSCGKGDAQNADRIVHDFNRLAKESFNKRYTLSDLDPLKEWEKCLLKVGVNNYLDDLNSWSLTIADSFYIRSYNFPDLETNFSFVLTKSEKAYFIYLPRYYDFKFGREHYNADRENYHLTLKDSIENSIVELNSPIVDNFFDHEVFESKDIYGQIKQVNHILPLIFPEILSHEVSLGSLLDSLKKESQVRSAYIKKVIDPLMLKLTRPNVFNLDLRVFETYIGFIIVDYSLNRTNSNKLHLTFYLVPKEKRISLIRDTETSKYHECN